MPSNQLILCHPLLLLPSILPRIRVLYSESALQIRWPKDWSFSFSISPSKEYSGLISSAFSWLYFSESHFCRPFSVSASNLSRRVWGHFPFVPVSLSPPSPPAFFLCSRLPSEDGPPPHLQRIRFQVLHRILCWAGKDAGERTGSWEMLAGTRLRPQPHGSACCASPGLPLHSN